MNRTPLILFITVCLVGAIALWQQRQAPVPQAFEPYALPDISIPLLDDGERLLTNADLPQDEPYLLHFIASWCVVCVAEHGYLMELQGKHLLPIYATGWKDTPEDLTPWLNRYGDFYNEVAIDTSGITGITLGVTGTPETLLIEGRQVLYHHRGAITPDIWKSHFKPYLVK